MYNKPQSTYSCCMGHGCTRSVEKSQIVYVVSVEEKQQFLREIPYGGAILSLVSVHLSHTNDSPTKAEPPHFVCRWNFGVWARRNKNVYTRV